MTKNDTLQKQIEEVHDLIGKSDIEALSKIENTSLLLARDKEGASPILRAAEAGDIGLVNILLTRVPQAVKTTDQVNNGSQNIGSLLIFE